MKLSKDQEGKFLSTLANLLKKTNFALPGAVLVEKESILEKVEAELEAIVGYFKHYPPKYKTYKEIDEDSSLIADGKEGVKKVLDRNLDMFAMLGYYFALRGKKELAQFYLAMGAAESGPRRDDLLIISAPASGGARDSAERKIEAALALSKIGGEGFPESTRKLVRARSSELLLSAAAEGAVGAFNYLGSLYLDNALRSGSPEPEALFEVWPYFQKAAQAGDRAGEKNSIEVLKRLEQLSLQGDQEAQLALAQVYIMLARDGDTEAFASLVDRLIERVEGKKDAPQAALLLTQIAIAVFNALYKSALGGDEAAKVNVGMAVVALRDLALLGDREAQEKLAEVCFIQLMNDKEVTSWMTLYAFLEQKHKEGNRYALGLELKILTALYEKLKISKGAETEIGRLIGWQLREFLNEYRKNLLSLEMAALAGDEEAQFNLGYYYQAKAKMGKDITLELECLQTRLLAAGKDKEGEKGNDQGPLAWLRIKSIITPLATGTVIFFKKKGVDADAVVTTGVGAGAVTAAAGGAGVGASTNPGVKPSPFVDVLGYSSLMTKAGQAMLEEAAARGEKLVAVSM